MFRNVRFRAEALCSIIKADLALESISTLCAKDARAFVKELLIYFVSSIAEAMIDSDACCHVSATLLT